MTPREQLDAAHKAKRGAAGKSKRKQDSRGRWHPSSEEADWFDVQYAREKRGEIIIAEIEPAYVIKGPAGEQVCVVKADMAIVERPALNRRVLDYKGRHGDTPVSRLKQRLARVFCGVEIEFVGPYMDRKAAEKAKAKAVRDLVRRSKSASIKRAKR